MSSPEKSYEPLICTLGRSTVWPSAVVSVVDASAICSMCVMNGSAWSLATAAAASPTPSVVGAGVGVATSDGAGNVVPPHATNPSSTAPKNPATTPRIDSAIHATPHSLDDHPRGAALATRAVRHSRRWTQRSIVALPGTYGVMSNSPAARLSVPARYSIR